MVNKYISITRKQRIVKTKVSIRATKRATVTNTNMVTSNKGETTSTVKAGSMDCCR
jgi:hypothetical protein